MLNLAVPRPPIAHLAAAVPSAGTQPFGTCPEAAQLGIGVDDPAAFRAALRTSCGPGQVGNAIFWRPLKPPSASAARSVAVEARRRDVLGNKYSLNTRSVAIDRTLSRCAERDPFVEKRASVCQQTAPDPFADQRISPFPVHVVSKRIFGNRPFFLHIGEDPLTENDFQPTIRPLVNKRVVRLLSF